ncbi:hypothetical protein, partial [Planococcus sp. CAU13]|uniref:hypothetical protein n=1 Tax=Planococcus sp. CAU13 TaxID=1541197 RepID=UPI00052FFE3A
LAIINESLPIINLDSVENLLLFSIVTEGFRLSLTKNLSSLNKIDAEEDLQIKNRDKPQNQKTIIGVFRKMVFQKRSKIFAGG